jgi:subtilisin family serine protease
MRFDVARWSRALVLSALPLLAATAARAETRAGEYLVRAALAAPTPATMSALLGVQVASVARVDGDLFKVKIAPTEKAAVSAKVLRARAEREAPGVVTHVQPNFVYHIDLARNADAVARAKALGASVKAAADNPAIQPANPSPARGPDPKLSSQWGANKIDAPTAWQTQRGNKNVVVAVIDTGVDYNHEDLRNALWRNPAEIPGNGIDDDGNGFVDDVVGWDFADNDAFPFDKMSASRIDGNPGHGTHCSGVVGGVGENAIGISGVAPNVSVMAVRFITDTGEGTTENAVKAIDYAVANGAKVLSNSWGGEKDDEDDTELLKAIQNAEAKGVLMVFAAGNGRNGIGYDNDGDPKPAVPASYDNPAIISVAATDSSDALGPFSNWGKTTVDLAAPGVKILSSVPGNKYEDSITIFGIPLAEWSGTSMAAPHVAGAAALVWSQFPNETAQQIKDRLLRSVTPLSSLSGKVVTGGLLNVKAAIAD